MLHHNLYGVGPLIGQGRHRDVFSHGQKYVVKVPLGEWGRGANYHEADISKKYGRRPDQNGIVYARCRLMKNDWLVMEAVDTEVKNLPHWADFVDCQQVGLARDGAFVAYDYGW